MVSRQLVYGHFVYDTTSTDISSTYSSSTMTFLAEIEAGVKNVILKADEGETRKLPVSDIQKSLLADSDSLLVKPFGCVFCDEMFQDEMEFKGHCVQSCYFPVDDDYAGLL